MMKIGTLALQNNIISAPMAGFTDMAWRIIAAELGSGLVFSEMISVEGLIRAGKKTTRYLKNDDRARPFGIQLFGGEAEPFERAFDVLKDFEFDLIDINAGCPVKKVVSRGAGAALMNDPKKIAAIIKAMRRSYRGPLTIKLRAGWKDINVVEVARIAEDAGADAVIIHPRTKEQGFRGASNWNLITAVKEAVKIKVIGNGDVVDKDGIEKMFSQTNCDGIMIGRAAIGNPWIFKKEKPPALKERFNLIRRHIRLLAELEDEHYTINMMKKFLPRYFKGVEGGRNFVKKIYSLDGLQDFEHLCEGGD